MLLKYGNDIKHSIISGCPVNFYFFKRSILVISDPRYYENFEWINEQLRQKWTT